MPIDGHSYTYNDGQVEKWKFDNKWWTLDSVSQSESKLVSLMYRPLIAI